VGAPNSPGRAVRSFGWLRGRCGGAEGVCAAAADVVARGSEDLTFGETGDEDAVLIARLTASCTATCEPTGHRWPALGPAPHTVWPGVGSVRGWGCPGAGARSGRRR
jgi:hypothetical protein